MSRTVLILPGYHGSGPTHWQTWMQDRLPGARRVTGIDWASPVLSQWAEAARRSILEAPGPVWLVAHSFGCLTAVTASRGLGERIAGALLVAPADPERFSPNGVRTGTRRNGQRSLAVDLPSTPLPFPSLVVASRNDPWMRLETIEHWAGLWGSAVIDIGDAGHINIDSGFGPWPQGLVLLRALQSGRFQRRPVMPIPARRAGPALRTPRPSTIHATQTL
ncbi:RBBP9/YdeN family alpha/beta hydrolase [Thiobaca trueperi]|uniref:Alpha/beta hydrolase n=1 Tax=Thiobaca trueperi TaxID=127458 RepID=A0A4R3MVL0_9GAMM|nr:alpha/beta hydrolase [Thiobaca trueperi]TCT19431.1 hypothetical protein EDC35_10837 [Thiobaca trueperi]